MKYYWSNSANCKYCGFTNKYFLIREDRKKGKIVVSHCKICKECHREKARVIEKRCQSKEDYKAKRRAYMKERYYKYKEYSRLAGLKWRAKMREARKLEKLRQVMVGKELK